MVTDLDCVTACNATYGFVPGWTWDFVLAGKTDADVWVGVKRFDDIDLIAFRGSTTWLDWERDFAACPYEDSKLGMIETGFNIGIDDVVAQLSPRLNRYRYAVTGHSLGSAHGDIFTGRQVVAGKPPLATVGFGCPRPGGADFAYVVRDVPMRRYRNMDAGGHDLVTDVPFKILGAPYQQPQILTNVTASPARDDPWLIFRYHHAPLYSQAIKAQATIPVIS